MSRPAVESTLFRARRRLTEEYDDIVSGARCQRIQGIILTAVEAKLGTRDTRRLARHLSHCQPCRREALVAGLDRELFARPTVRERVANKVAGILPFPIFAKLRKSSEGAEAAAPPPSGRAAAFMQHMPMLSDHAAERLGQGRRGRRGDRRRRGRGRRRQAGHDDGDATAGRRPVRDADAPRRARRRPRPGGDGHGRRAVGPGEREALERRRGQERAHQGHVQRREGRGQARRRVRRRAEDHDAPRRPQRGGAPTTPAAQSDSGSSPPREDSLAAGSGREEAAAAQKRTPVKDAVQDTTSSVGTTVTNTTGAVEETTSAVTETVNETTQAVTETVDKVVEGVTGGGPVAETVDKVDRHRRRRRGRCRQDGRPDRGRRRRHRRWTYGWVEAASLRRVARLLCVRGVAQPGSARRSGRRGPRFKSGRPDT